MTRAAKDKSKKEADQDAVKHEIKRLRENKELFEQGLLGAPIHSSVSEEAMRDPHAPEHRKEVRRGYELAIKEEVARLGALVDQP